MKKGNINSYSWITCALLAFNAITQVFAAPGTLANSPLFTTKQYSSNVFFELDDSGSMDWETLTKKYWDACAYDRDNPGSPTTTDSDCGSLIFGDGLFRTWSGSAFRNYAYLFDNSDNLYDSGCNGQFYPKLEGCSGNR